MDIIITEWALDAYLDLLHRNVFTKADYWKDIRPEVERLKSYPNDPKFQNSKFWGRAQDKNGTPIQHGYKMKWHHLGPGQVQLRLGVVVLTESLLCQAWVKSSSYIDKIEAAKLKARINLIAQNRHIIRGKL